ncbi:hypothetical protein BGL34_04600 [Fructilactobacillus lindneri]|uniref:MucBP domain-containing protein n=2 Tax=Fructilactobacillus lindneri TaxID=53444 RepID=A0A0R2JM11_9LACO|nr:MucBP domain-containing protein [Fructilactobacillus lindneri]ANZ57577.1 hypothetical protein AYR60_01700 [Fructilactobacillus lindneri]ANZ58846.1 hypothetical protein AYR59_01700 [Fructilactobacillus lindneri]KRN78233.1 hypothetical protein IV52_GL001367 [Fructilactobacillus lindneri DSM 20690 = JCM 11027]POG97729.1 hypothetical protein BGL31_05845 [Fructilactobacillus lindneri]POH00047.1 hypothetical protein BGL32_04620 [Fructilactobacillus lindneri]
MNIKKTTSIFLVSSALLGFGISAPSLMHVNAQTTQASQNNDQGVITVNYVDQNGKTIRQATTATGKSGSTYVASVPNISGYTYSKIENGQNDSYGPQMVFGGSDPATHNESMTIVYKSSGNSSNGSTSTTGNKGTTTTPAKNGSSNNSNKNSTSVSTNKNDNSNGTKFSTNKNATTNGTNKNSSSAKTNGTTVNSDAQNEAKNNDENKVNASNTNKDNSKQDNNSDSNVDKKNKTNNKKDNKNKDKNADDKNSDSTKKKDKKKTHHSIMPWVISGIILVVVAGIAFSWHALRKPRHFRH